MLFWIETLGCKVNTYESEVIKSLFLNENFKEAKTSEEADGMLAYLTTSLTLTGYETGLYYRVRGLHGVEYNDELEACATESDGVLITD